MGQKGGDKFFRNFSGWPNFSNETGGASYFRLQCKPDVRSRAANVAKVGRLQTLGNRARLVKPASLKALKLFVFTRILSENRFPLFENAL